MRKLLIILGLALTACSNNPPQLNEMITCTVAYRSSVKRPIEQEEMLTFTSERDEQLLVFADAIFHAAYDPGKINNERSLRLWITDVGNETVYQSQLYQLSTDSSPQNQFMGGHGFTGLHYNYPANSSAELQFWCSIN